MKSVIDIHILYPLLPDFATYDAAMVYFIDDLQVLGQEQDSYKKTWKSDAL